MKNRILYLVAAGALALPVAAAPSDAEWNLYGTLAVELYNMKTTGASTGASTAPALTGTTYPTSITEIQSRNRMTCGGSNLGFKGSYKLADDLKVFWQIETTVNADGDYSSGGIGGIGTRNTGLGLQGSWGTVLGGQWDTPYKNVQQATQQYPTTLMFDAWILNTPGFNVPASTTASTYLASKKDASFNRRQGNSIQYWSPVVQGFQAKVAYSIDEGKTASSTSYPQQNPWLFSGHISYQNGPLKVMYAYERHNDYYGLNQMLASTITTTASSKDEGHILGAFLDLPTGTKITAVGEQLKFSTDGLAATSVSEYKRVAWHASVAQTFLGQHKVWIAYGSAAEGSAHLTNGTSTSTDGLGAQQYTVGYNYALNKNTNLFAVVFGMINDKSAQYALSYTSVASTNVPCGADTRGAGIGMVYKF